MTWDYSQGMSTGDEVAKKIDAHFSTYPSRTYPKGQILIFGGEEPTGVFYLTKGRVRQYDVSYRGDEVIVNTFKPPAFFPMSWAFNQTPNKYFFKTETQTTFHIVPREEALKFVKANQDVMEDLLTRLYRGMDGLLGRVVHLMSGSAQSRVMYELLVEAERFGKQQPDGTVLLGIKETGLAAQSGLSRETVSREIHKLKDKQLVEVTTHNIILKDLKALKTKLGEY
jgi:CRP-like cAMP-binding protein